MIGNLLVFVGPEALNAYGRFLREFVHGGAIWVVRFTLLASVVLHVAAATALTTGSWGARPTRYRVQRHRDSTFASRTMRWSGPLIAVFVVYHLLHLTVGSAHPDFREGDVYHNVIAGFRVWPVTVFYVVCVVGLGLHLYHGAWSMLQTLGLSHPRWNRLRFAVCAGLTILMAAGFCAVPLAVLGGFVR
jgi:succinate dehydrogenase / fumarate reductase cytochrome b subunit